MKNYKAENLESLSASIHPFNCKDFNYPLSIIHSKNYVKSSDSTRRQRT